MAQKITVTIVGLGRLGASAGLALQRYNRKDNPAHTFEIVGVEERPAMLQAAEKMGAVGKSERNLYRAVQDRDIVVLAAPYAESRRTFQAMGEGLRAGGVVLDFSPLKMPAIKWAKEYFPAEAHLVGLAPVVNPKYLYDGLDDTEHAVEDFFDKGSMMLMPSPSCIREAVELASDFSALLGASVHYMDPMEHDALVSATLGLPTLLGVATFYNLSRNPGWGDIQRLTNPPFGRLTHQLFDTHPDDLRDLWLHNRDSLVHYLDGLIGTLGEMRQVLANNDEPALEAVVTEAADDYSTWINRRHNNKWDEARKSDAPAAGETIMTGLMGGFLARKLRGDDKSK
jgi:prephenate dehydrogenase